MADDLAKIDSMLDEVTDDNEEERIQQAIERSNGSAASRIFNKGINKIGDTAKNIAGSITGVGTKAAAGGMAIAQSTSMSSVAVLLSVVFGINLASGDGMTTEYRDDSFPDNPYECLDEYEDAYKGVFGTINTSPLAEQNSTVVKRLKEINEWSKAYVGQSIPDKLVCMEPTCPLYQHEGCKNPEHQQVRKVDDSEYTYYDLGGKIDLANVMRIHSFFSAYGLTDVQIAAICGVMTVESRIDFTSLEGYNLSGDRYNLDPSVKTDEYGFKPWAEGIGDSPIETPTCIHEIAANQDSYAGDDKPIDYGDYSSEYGSIHKLGIGIVGFTDGPGFWNNTFLRNYADFLNDKVVLIQNIVEGSQGWRETLRRRAADLYHYAFGAEGEDKRGTANSYVEKVDPSTLLTPGAAGAEKSTGWRYKEAYEAYAAAEAALEAAINEYNSLSAQYQSVADQLNNTNWSYSNVSSSDSGQEAYDITFEEHSFSDMKKYTTDTASGNYLDATNAEELKKCGPTEYVYGYVEYPENPTGPKNNIDVVFPHAEPIYEETSAGALSDFSASYSSASVGSPPKEPTRPSILDEPPREQPTYNPFDPTFPQRMQEWAAWYSAYRSAQESYSAAMRQYNSDVAAYNASKQAADVAAAAEHARVQGLIDQANSLKSQMQAAYANVQQKKEEFFATVAELNAAALEHAKMIVQFYNALQDYYTASEFDMESKLRDATLTDSTIFGGDVEFYSREAYEYEFQTKISQASEDTEDDEKVKFKDVFDELGTGEVDADGNPVEDQLDEYGRGKPTTQQLRLYYELWQNYAKYATNLPASGKYINWWTPEVQLLFLVGGSYDAETGKGLKIKDEYRDISCGQCAPAPEYDNTGEYYYKWMSTWKGENYTARDITTATKNFFHDMISGGFDDGTITLRTEYAYAYYYMFQYDSPYQQAINYASVGGEASKIMEEMIAEGRWQTNTSNTLSDRAMPHNDKWNEFQEEYNNGSIRRQWEMDTSTSMTSSILGILGEKQSHSQVNLLTDIYNSCKYINVIENSTIGNAAMYLVDDPLIDQPGSDFYNMKYGGYDLPPEYLSDHTKVVYTIINKRLEDNGKTKMSSNVDNGQLSGFDFVKTAILWSGMDVEFENITNVDELKDYIGEAASSVWQDEESYQGDDKHKVGSGNTKIWEQRRLGPYYDENGNVYYRYKWYLVPRVLSDEDQVDTGSTSGSEWYDDMRSDPAEKSFGDIDEDMDKIDKHGVDEHNTNNTPSTESGADVNGYERKLSENGQIADWVRVDWECWDKNCEICGGKGGHGDVNSLAPGDIIISPDDEVYLWLGEDMIKSMYPLTETLNASDPLVMAGGSTPTQLKSMTTTGFEWSKPCNSYINHDTPCPEHGALSTLPTSPEPSGLSDDEDSESTESSEESEESSDTCELYNPDGKWTVYRLVTPNYTDAYRSAGVILDPVDERTWADDGEWETWYKYKYKGMSTYADTKKYLEQVREEVGKVIDDSESGFDRDIHY